MKLRKELGPMKDSCDSYAGTAIRFAKRNYDDVMGKALLYAPKIVKENIDLC
jgi:hypothetical protein